MNLFKTLFVAALILLGSSQSASATSVTYSSNGGAFGAFTLIAPNSQRPTWRNDINVDLNGVNIVVNDTTGQATLSGTVNFTNYVITSNPVNNAQNWINSSQGNYSIAIGGNGITANNAAGVGQFVASFYGTNIDASHTVDLALHGLQNQWWCSVPNNCGVTQLGGGNVDQYVGGWALGNPGWGNLSFGLVNRGNNTYELLGWFGTMNPYTGSAIVYQLDIGRNGSGALFHVNSTPPGPSVPEPATVALLGGSLALGAYRKRKNGAA